MLEPEVDPSAIYTCPICATWYSKSTAPISELDDELLWQRYCNCNDKKTKLIDAHCAGILTPHDERRLDELDQERIRLYRRLQDIHDEMCALNPDL